MSCLCSELGYGHFLKETLDLGGASAMNHLAGLKMGLDARTPVRSSVFDLMQRVLLGYLSLLRLWETPELNEDSGPCAWSPWLVLLFKGSRKSRSVTGDLSKPTLSSSSHTWLPWQPECS